MDEDDFPDTPLARKLFPTWFALRPLFMEMELLREDRYDYAIARIAKEDAGLLDVLKRSSDLFARIKSFQKAGETRAIDIMTEIQESENAIKEHEKEVDRERRKALGLSDYWYQHEWETDEDEAESAIFDVRAAEQKISSLRSRLIFEATMSGVLEEVKGKFAARAMLKDSELVEWTNETNVGLELQKFRHGVAESLSACVGKLFAIMYERMEEQKEKEQKYRLRLLQDEEQKSYNMERNNLSVMAQAFKPMPFTHNPQHPHYAYQTPQTAGPEFCEHCKVIGHATIHCKIVYPDQDDNESTCGHCHKDGHHKFECWELYPELQREYEKKLQQSRDKACEECGAKGKARSFCYKLHHKTVTQGPTLPIPPPAMTYSADTAPSTNLLTSQFPPWNAFGPMAIDDFVAVHGGKPAPVADFDYSMDKYCGFCDEFGHRDMDCQRADDTKTTRAPQVDQKVRKFARPVR